MNRLIQTKSVKFSNSVGSFNFVKICFSILFETLTTKSKLKKLRLLLKFRFKYIFAILSRCYKDDTLDGLLQSKSVFHDQASDKTA